MPLWVWATYPTARPARSPRTRTDTIALVVPEPEPCFFAEPYFSDIVRGVGAALADTDTQLLLTLVGNDRERRRPAQYLTAHRVDGVLLVSVHADDPLRRAQTREGPRSEDRGPSLQGE
ncbi:sugar binding domain of LacI family protein [Streptomyces atratus]|uniref:Sugar binding domain of LacI family protein n=1 Tax=Streptomyces atratus TaxID=1893 RepID=A0A1K2F772_STRAR|nr:sugar binding domain of LacI family protein [Streptomyces atratus]